MPDLKEALPIFFERFNAAVTVWNLQLTVILGLIAFLAVASSVMQNKPATDRTASKPRHPGWSPVSLWPY
jgi:hypothetical protein